MFPVDEGSLGFAIEVAANRKSSVVGYSQMHFRLDPALVIPEGVCTGVVVIPGQRGTYVYPSNVDGDIAVYDTVADAPRGTGVAAILAVMGYRVVGAGVPAPGCV